MKERAVTYLSLVVSFCALCYAAWDHQHSQEMAVQALKQREAEFVRHVAPTLKTVVSDITQQTNIVVANPATMEDLIRMAQPIFKLTERPK